jgi:hypothetical protein
MCNVGEEHTRITDTVEIGIFLSWVVDVRTVIEWVSDVVAVRIRRYILVANTHLRRICRAWVGGVKEPATIGIL